MRRETPARLSEEPPVKAAWQTSIPSPVMRFDESGWFASLSAPVALTDLLSTEDSLSFLGGGAEVCVSKSTERGSSPGCLDVCLRNPHLGYPTGLIRYTLPSRPIGPLMHRENHSLMESARK